VSTDPTGPALRTLRLTLAYDGAAYQGWQRQPGRPTVQAAVEEAVRAVTGARRAVHASGRTDSGVHALAQVAHLRTECRLAAETLIRALNANLPGDIVVRRIEDAPPGFHARHHARRKTYFYQFHVAPERHPFWRRFALHLRAMPDVDAMRQAAAILQGRHDFRSFVTNGRDQEDAVRTLYALRVQRTRSGLRVFATADGFLQHMVRALAGLIMRVGTGRESLGGVADILAARDRCAAPASLPPHGLFLWKVEY